MSAMIVSLPTLCRIGGACLLILLWSAGLPDTSEAQRLPDRHFITNPFWDARTSVEPDASQLVNSYGGWAAFGPYLTGDSDHAWHHEIGGFVELWRSHRTSLLVTTQIEFIADPNNEINFNPRAVLWEEGIVLTRRQNTFDWQVGYYHRCKHDIDNLAIGEQRASIFGSLRGRLILPARSDETDDYLALETNFYTIRQDARLPRVLESEGRNWNQLLASVGAQGFTRIGLPAATTDLYAQVRGRLSVLSANEGFFNRLSAVDQLRGSFGTAIGVSVRGRAEMRLGLEYEYSHDTGIPAVPTDAHLLRVVLRAHPLDLVR